jgi:hypothetical protein
MVFLLGFFLVLLLLVFGFLCNITAAFIFVFSFVFLLC